LVGNFTPESIKLLTIALLQMSCGGTTGMFQNRQLKHLNADSIHAKACFKAIPSGVHNRLSELTTIAETKKNLPPDKICPQHFQETCRSGHQKSLNID